MSYHAEIGAWLLGLWACGLVIALLSLRLLHRREPVSATKPEPCSLYLADANGTVYLAEPAHVWEADGRAHVYYEDEERPDDATPLYRLRLEGAE